MRFGEKLSFLRKQRGMTQMDLAEKLDISRQAVSRWEQGISEPSTENLVSIGKLFDVTVDALVNEDVQLQIGSAVLVAEPEEKEMPEKRNKYSILKIVGIILFAVAVLLVVCIGLVKDKQNPVPMDDITKGEVNASEAVTVPINLKE